MFHEQNDYRLSFQCSYTHFQDIRFHKRGGRKNSGRLRTEEILNLQTKGNFSNFIEYTFNLYLLNLPPTTTLATLIKCSKQSRRISKCIKFQANSSGVGSINFKIVYILECFWNVKTFLSSPLLLLFSHFPKEEWGFYSFQWKVDGKLLGKPLEDVEAEEFSLWNL